MDNRAIFTACDIGKRICQRRQELGLTQEALAERIEVTSQQVQRYEYGKNRLNVENLQRIAQALDVPVTYFFAGQDWEPQNADVLCHEEQRVVELYRGIGDGVVKGVVVSMLRAAAQEGREN